MNVTNDVSGHYPQTAQSSSTFLILAAGYEFDEVLCTPSSTNPVTCTDKRIIDLIEYIAIVNIKHGRDGVGSPYLFQGPVLTVEPASSMMDKVPAFTQAANLP